MDSNLKVTFLGVNISAGSYSDISRSILKLAKERISSYVCVMNVHMLIEARKNFSFADVVDNADLVTPDGMPLAKGISIFHNYHQERIAGMDLLPDLLMSAEQEGLRVFFYGGTEEMQAATKLYVKRSFPNLITTGFYSPPFRDLTLDEENEIAEKINLSATNILFVALGCPKQEKWMSGMKGRINSCMIGIGGALPVMVGIQQRAPTWMQKNSLEWLYRLYQEPGRLWKRYFYTNSLFIWLFSVEYLKRTVRPNN